jgi:hypothetical protein
MPQLKDDRQVQVIVFEGDGKGDDIEIGKKTSGFQGKERIAGLLVLGQVFRVGEKEPLAEGVVAAVEQVINGKETEIAHRLVIGVWIDQGDRESATPWIGTAATFCLQPMASFVDELAGHT